MINSVRHDRIFSAAFIVALAFFFSSTPTQAADQDLRKATQALISGGTVQAKGHARSALKEEPGSRLAHWIEAQSLLALAGRPVEINGVDQEFLDEARVRLEVTPSGMLPRNLMVMPAAAEKNVPVLLADAERSRIYVFASKDGVPTLIDEFYTSIGALGFDKAEEGDRKTPLGVYRIRYEIRDPRKDGFLGKMAMTLDYPNAYDNMKGRTGSGIWIHGVPDFLHVRPPKSSDGCLAVSNRDLQRLRGYVRYQESQIVVVPKVEWITPKQWQANYVKAVKDFALHYPREELGVFYVNDSWPWVLSVSSATAPNRFRREYWERSRFGQLRRVLQEPLS